LALLKDKTATQFRVSNKEIGYFVVEGTLTNNAYNPKHDKIKMMLNTVVDEVIGKNEAGRKTVTGVRLKNVKTGELIEHSCEGLFIAIGHEPNTKIFKGILDMDETGYLITEKSSMKTNIPGVFACGDAQDKYYRQAVTAAGTGGTA